MRKLLCERCGARRTPGRREVLPAGPHGDPAEWERVVRGAARNPTPEQRAVSISSGPTPDDIRDRKTFQMDPSHYNCDWCGGEIRPGEPATAWTLWLATQGEPPAWEREFLEVSP